MDSNVYRTGLNRCNKKRLVVKQLQFKSWSNTMYGQYSYKASNNHGSQKRREEQYLLEKIEWNNAKITVPLVNYSNWILILVSEHVFILSQFNSKFFFFVLCLFRDKKVRMRFFSVSFEPCVIFCVFLCSFLRLWQPIESFLAANGFLFAHLIPLLALSIELYANSITARR